MCMRNVRISDEVIELMKPHFKGDEDLQLWIEEQLEHVMWEYAQQFKSDLGNETKNEHIYRQIKALENDANGLFKLGDILKPSQYSVEELRDEYISDKYGV